VPPSRNTPVCRLAAEIVCKTTPASNRHSVSVRFISFPSALWFWGLVTLPRDNREPLVVKDEVGRPSGELGMSKSVECDAYLLQCSDTVGWATGRASGLWIAACWFVSGDAIWLQLRASYSYRLSPLLLDLDLDSDLNRKDLDLDLRLMDLDLDWDLGRFVTKSTFNFHCAHFAVFCLGRLPSRSCISTALHGPFSQLAFWQVSRCSSELSPQSLSPSQSWRRRTQTLVVRHLYWPAAHVVTGQFNSSVKLPSRQSSRWSHTWHRETQTRSCLPV